MLMISAAGGGGPRPSTVGSVIFYVLHNCELDAHK